MEFLINCNIPFPMWSRIMVWFYFHLRPYDPLYILNLRRHWTYSSPLKIKFSPTVQEMLVVLQAEMLVFLLAEKLMLCWRILRKCLCLQKCSSIMAERLVYFLEDMIVSPAGNASVNVSGILCVSSDGKRLVLLGVFFERKC